MSCMPYPVSYSKNFGVKGQLMNPHNSPISKREINIIIATKYGDETKSTITTDSQGFFCVEAVEGTYWTIAISGPVPAPPNEPTITVIFERSKVVFESVPLNDDGYHQLGKIVAKVTTNCITE